MPDDKNFISKIGKNSGRDKSDISVTNKSDFHNMHSAFLLLSFPSRERILGEGIQAYIPFLINFRVSKKSVISKQRSLSLSFLSITLKGRCARPLYSFSRVTVSIFISGMPNSREIAMPISYGERKLLPTTFNKPRAFFSIKKSSA